MRSALTIARFILVISMGSAIVYLLDIQRVAANEFSLQNPHRVLICRSSLYKSKIPDHWPGELEKSLKGFAVTLNNLGYPTESGTLPSNRCPKQIRTGCYSKSGTIYCSDLALERAIFSLALLLHKAETFAKIIHGPKSFGKRHLETMLDILGRKTPGVSGANYSGYVALSTVDYYLHPGTFSSADTELRVWGSEAEDLHRKPAMKYWDYARDIVVWFIVGHESFHSLRRCAISVPSFSEQSGHFDALTSMQQQETFCPNPPDNNEVNADSCGLRWLELLERRYRIKGLDATNRKVAHASAMLILQSLFQFGLDPIKQNVNWKPTGYLWPHLRTAVVHRTLYNLNMGDLRLGLCDWSLEMLLDYTRGSAFSGCSGIMKPSSAKAMAFFERVAVPSKTPGLKNCKCLEGTVMIESKSLTRGDPSVAIRVVDLQPEVEGQFVLLSLESAQREISRLPIHSALSACLPGEVRSRQYRLKYSYDSNTPGVSGHGDLAEQRCVQKALANLTFGDTIETAPLDPNKPFPSPGWTMVIKLERVK